MKDEKCLFREFWEMIFFIILVLFGALVYDHFIIKPREYKIITPNPIIVVSEDTVISF
jgi:hypothetical protein